MGSKSKTLMDLFLHQLKDLHYAEKHIGKFLPKLAKAASSDALKQVLDKHRDEEHAHVERLETIFGLIDKKVHGVPCEAIQGLIEEAKELLQDFEDSEALDAGILAAAQAMEHYEIARYTSLSLWAGQLGLADVTTLLETTLAEERQANQRLADLAGGLSVPRPGDGPDEERLTLKTAALAGLG